MVKKLLILFFVIILSSYVYAIPYPVLYGQAFNGVNPADGSIVTAYLENNQSNTVTDVVGISGETNLSTYWQINLNRFNTDFANGDIIEIHISDGENESTRIYLYDSEDRAAILLGLNYNPGYQDYDDDGYTADVDCDDTNKAINPGASDTCGNSIDEDCSGSDAACSTSSSGGGSRRRRSSSSTVVCTPDWTCTSWSECGEDNVRVCFEWADNNNCNQEYTGENTESCIYEEPQVEATTEEQKETEQTTEEKVNLPEDFFPEVQPEQAEEPEDGVTITGRVVTTLGDPSTLGIVVVLTLILLLFFFYKRKREPSFDF
jgi:hypothetical protein